MPKPVFCPVCRSVGSWERDIKRDIYGESGKLLWEAWVCKVCGHKAIYPVGDVNEAKIQTR